MGVYHYPIVKQWIEAPDFPHIPYRKGIGMWEGVCMHYTDNDNDTAEGEASYESNTWQKAFVAEFISWRIILQVSDPQYSQWGVGPVGNKFLVNLELCSAKTQEQFNQSFDMWCERAAEYLASNTLGVVPANDDNRGVGATLWSHLNVTKYLGGTDHTDPIAYLKRWGKEWQDVVDRVKIYYDGIIAEHAPNNPPDPRPATTKTPILGAAIATVDQLREFIRLRNPNAPDVAQLYLDIGAKYGVRGDMAFCDGVKETGSFTFKRPDGTPGDVSPEQNNYCGLGAVGGGAKGASFKTQAEGVEAHIQHLFGYATVSQLPAGTTLVDPRFNLLAQVGKRGVAPYWEDLDGKWADPGIGYGESVVTLWKELCAVVPPAQPEPPAADPNQWKQDAMQFLKDKKIINGDHDPDSPVTWAELGSVLKNIQEAK